MQTNLFTNASRKQQVEATAEAMRILGEGCTSADLKNKLGCTQPELEAIADDARGLAMARAERHTRFVVPARRAA